MVFLALTERMVLKASPVKMVPMVNKENKVRLERVVNQETKVLQVKMDLMDHRVIRANREVLALLERKEKLEAMDPKENPECPERRVQREIKEARELMATSSLSKPKLDNLFHLNTISGLRSSTLFSTTLHLATKANQDLRDLLELTVLKESQV